MKQLRPICTRLLIPGFVSLNFEYQIFAQKSITQSTPLADDFLNVLNAVTHSEEGKREAELVKDAFLGPAMTGQTVKLIELKIKNKEVFAEICDRERHCETYRKCLEIIYSDLNDLKFKYDNLR